MLKKSILTICALLLFACGFSIDGAHQAWAKPFEQETYLFMKQDAGADPWPIIRPDGDFPYDVAWGKLEYSNWTESGEFCFDFKGYNLMPDQEYALIYYKDPGPGSWGSSPPEVYVFGTAVAELIETKGNFGAQFIGVKIDGCCDIEQLPYDDTDVNYPNGAKIWLVPTYLLGEFEECGWTQMAGWDSGVILFETSLLTFGFVVTD